MQNQKPWKSYQAQLNILKARGLKVGDEAKARMGSVAMILNRQKETRSVHFHAEALGRIENNYIVYTIIRNHICNDINNI